MRKKHPIDALFAKTRKSILAAIVMHPKRSWYLSDLAKHIGTPPSSLHRELLQLVKAGIIKRWEDGNRVYYQADLECPFHTELENLLTKTVGLIEVLRETLKPILTKIDYAFVYGSLARGEELSRSDIDLMVIGSAGLVDLAPLLKQAEKRLLRPVNATVYTKEEFTKNLQNGHHFLATVLEGKKLAVFGDSNELARAFGKQSGKTAHHKQAGNLGPSRGSKT